MGGFGIGHCAFPLPEAHGYSIQCKAPEALKVFGMFSRLNIVDQVEVPKDLPPGDYVLSWRWDCEQTPQIWAGCGDVTIVAPTRKIQSSRTNSMVEPAAVELETAVV